MNHRSLWDGAKSLRLGTAVCAAFSAPIVGFFLATTPAIADETPSFPEVVRQAERSSPRLMEVAAAIDAADGRAKQAAAWPNPVAGAEVEDIAGTGAYRGTAQSQTTLTLSEPLELGGQRGARAAMGRANLNEARARSLQQRADFGFDLAIAFAAAEAAQNRVELLAQDAESAREDLRIAHALVAAGKEGELRAVQIDAAAAAADAELASARAEQVAALTQLGSLVGDDAIYAGVKPSLLQNAVAVRAEAAAAGETSPAPAILTAQAERESADRRLIVEQRRAIPTPSLSVGIRRIAGDDATVWVAGFSIPIPLFDRNRGEIAAAHAEVRAADARLDAARLQAAAQRRAAAAKAAAANNRLAATERGESAAREAYRLARIGYEAGRSPLIELLSTRRAFIDAQLHSLEARLARVEAEAILARLAGRIPFVE